MDISAAIKGLVETSYQAIKREDVDYVGEDGLLYCGQCKTRKQSRIVVSGETIEPMCLCKCEYEKQEAKRKKEMLDGIRESYKTICFQDGKMQDWTFEKDDGQSSDKIMTVARKYADNFEKMRDIGKGLLLCGSVGCGKTFAAACILNELVKKCFYCKMTTVQRIVDKLQANIDRKEEVYLELERYDLLCLDDLSSERKTEFVQEIVYNIIDRRYRSGKPIIVTSNISLAELKNPSEVTNQRIYSRLLEMCFPYESNGKDRRRKKCGEDYIEYAEMLGLKGEN